MMKMMMNRSPHPQAHPAKGNVVHGASKERFDSEVHAIECQSV